jgi:hypothetical protein
MHPASNAFPAPRPSRLAAASAALLSAALLCACATSYAPTGIRAGDARARVVDTMGAPAATYTLPDGHERLEYSHMPDGLQTWMIDLDASGRVVRWEQVLDETHFGAIGAGLTETEVLRMIGPPSMRGHYWRPVEATTWSYRFQTAQRCIVFQLSFDVKTHRTLEYGAYPPDPRCGRTMS